MTAQIKKGFTLIELLVVIAVIGVLAIVVFVAINPLQMLARTRDSGRKSTVSQMGNALGAYATSHSGNYVAEAGTGCTPATWIGCLVTSGEITVTPSVIGYSISGITACATNNPVNGYCYDVSDAALGTAPAIAYARMESQAENSKCTVAGTVAYFVWSSKDGRAGIFCKASDPVQSDTFAGNWKD